MKYFVGVFLLLISCMVCAQKKILNMYVWSGEIPDKIIRQFEKQTGIKVNLSTYDNNEILYAKLRTAKHAGYDLILPSGYFVDRMRKQNMLSKIKKNKLKNLKNLNPEFTNPAYDPNSFYSIPYLWGLTGIFYNDQYYSKGSIHKWADLWDARYHNKLMLLDDTREIFSIGLLASGYSANDQNPEHIKQAFIKLQALMKNVKVFSSDTVVSIIIDEDVTVGTAWNGDVFKTVQENPHINFVFPEEGFVIWVDNLCIPKNAPHKNSAYAFIDFILNPEIGKQIALATHYATTNLPAQNLLPETIRNNPIIYPSKKTLAHGQFQTDVSEATLVLYEKYWEELKMGGSPL